MPHREIYPVERRFDSINSLQGSLFGGPSARGDQETRAGLTVPLICISSFVIYLFIFI